MGYWLGTGKNSLLPDKLRMTINVNVTSLDKCSLIRDETPKIGHNLHRGLREPPQA
jgi:hypothetical protein